MFQASLVSSVRLFSPFFVKPVVVQGLLAANCVNSFAFVFRLSACVCVFVPKLLKLFAYFGTRKQFSHYCLGWNAQDARWRWQWLIVERQNTQQLASYSKRVDLSNWIDRFDRLLRFILARRFDYHIQWNATWPSDCIHTNESNIIIPPNRLSHSIHNWFSISCWL